MGDLMERLKRWPALSKSSASDYALMIEAAAELTRLTAERDAAVAREVREDCVL